MGPGRRLVAVLVGTGVLLLAPSAAAADQLLETLNVDPANTAVTTGTVQLKQGTEYQLQVSGTFTLANGYGQSFEEDALYCFGDTGFATPQCTPTPQRLGDFYIGSGSSSLKNIDAYQEPGGGGPQIGYGITHRYNVSFHPAANGPLTAAGTLAYSHCKSGPNPCTTTISGGPITIQVYGPGPTPPPPPPPPKSAITFVPPVTNWGLSTGNLSLAARLTAVVTGPKLAKGQTDATETVSGPGVGNTSAEAVLVERAQIAQCIGFAVSFAGLGSTEKRTIFVKTGTKTQIKQVDAESGNDVAATFFVALIMCISDAQQKHSGKAVDAVAASGCPTSIEKLKYTELDLKRIRYVRAGRGTAPRLTTTCTRTSSGLTIHLHSTGTDLRGLFGARLLLGLYQRSGNATAQVTFSNNAAPPPPPPPTFTGNWTTTWFGAMHLTQTGNQVMGTYALCNGAATISGTVTGSTLDGTWTEPCDGGQGRVHVALSADGNSFSGQWGEGTKTPSVSWTGTRTS